LPWVVAPGCACTCISRAMQHGDVCLVVKLRVQGRTAVTTQPALTVLGRSRPLRLHLLQHGDSSAAGLLAHGAA
jgi:hypothetical protein